MSCETYFSLSNLQGSSLESEIGWSSNCVPNTRKLIVFIIMLVWSIGTTTVAAFYLISEFKKTNTWTLRRKVHLLLILGSLAEAILLVLHLNGVQSRARYLLVPLIELGVVSASLLLIQIFVRVFAEIIRKTDKDSKLQLLQKWNIWFMGAFCAIDYVLYAVMPMVFYDNPLLLNVFYSASIAVMMLGAAFICASFFFVSQRLAQLLQPSADLALNPDLEAVRKKLVGCMIIGATFGLSSLAGMLFPLWVGLTAVNGDPGMQGIFYFHFCYVLTFHLSGYSAVIWVSLKAKGKGGTSQNDSQLEKQNSSFKEKEQQNSVNFASFTIDELNPTA